MGYGTFGLLAELNINGTWTDVSGDVVADSFAAITRGRPDEASATEPSESSFSLLNMTGTYSPKNPEGTYYPYLGRNTQCRISVDEGASYLRSEVDQLSYASTPDSVNLSITGPTDVRIDLTLDNWNANQVLCGKYATAGNNRSWLLLLNENATLTFCWSVDGTFLDTQTATSDAYLPVPPLGRMAVRATVATTTGNVTFYTASTIGGSWTQLGDVINGTAAAIFDSTASVIVGGPGSAAISDFPGYTGIYGKVHGFQLLSGIGGTTEASPDFTSQTPGISSFNDAQSNTWTLGGTAEISNRKFRFHGEISEFDQQIIDPSGNVVYANITASGILRRLNINDPLSSVFYRYWTNRSGTDIPVAYWPCEDKTNSTQFASGLSGGLPMVITSGSPSFASSSPFACSDALPAINNGSWTGTVLNYTAGSAHQVNALVSIPSGGDTNNAILWGFQTNGTIALVQLLYTTASGGTLSLRCYDQNNAFLSVTPPSITGVNGQDLLVGISVGAPSGGNSTVTLKTLPVGGSVTTGTDSVPASSLGNVRSVTANMVQFGGNSAVGTVVGHFSVQAESFSLSTNASNALAAYAGETAGNRFSRLCSEEGINFRGNGNLDDTILMGVQTQSKLVDLLQECTDADRGVMFEPRQQFGLGYRTRASLQNQAIAVTLDYAQQQLSNDIEAIEDDYFTHNDVTVTSNTGTSNRQILSSGTLSTANPPSGVGSYPASYTLNLYTDSSVLYLAGWLLHMGTINEPRYPTISVELSRSAVSSLLHNLQELDLGDFLEVVNPPAWLPPDPVKQLIDGVTEKIGHFTYEIDWNTVAETPYELALVNDATYGHVDTDGSTTHSSFNSSVTQMDVDTATGSNYPFWTTSSSDFTFDVNVAGERMTVRDVNGPPANFLTGDNSAFDSSRGNWTNSVNSALAIVGSPAHSGSGALQLTSAASGDMTAASCQAANILTQGMACAAGDTISLAAWLETAVSARTCSVGAQFYTSGGTSISTLFAANTITDATGSYTKISGTVTAPATAAFCRMMVKVSATGAANEIHYLDDAYMSDVTTGSANTQTFRIVRSINGVTKSQASGSDVRLFFPPVTSL